MVPPRLTGRKGGPYAWSPVQPGSRAGVVDLQESGPLRGLRDARGEMDGRSTPGEVGERWGGMAIDGGEAKKGEEAGFPKWGTRMKNATII